jgi:hypothetical protein
MSATPAGPLLRGTKAYQNVQVNRITKLSGLAMLPRTTTSSISLPTRGQIVFDDDLIKFYDDVYPLGTWRVVTSA